MTLRFDLVADAEQVDAKQGDAEQVGAVVGMGHLHRCLALSEALRDKGASVRLFLPNPSLAEKMFSRPVFGSWQSLWQEDAPERREMLVVDSYRLASLPIDVEARYRHVACFHDDQPPPAFAELAICCDLSTKNSACSLGDKRSFRGGRYFPFHDRFARKATATATATAAATATATFAENDAAAGEGGERGEGGGGLLVWFGGRERGEGLVPLLTEDVLGGWRAEVVISPVVEPCASLLALARVRAGRVRVHHAAGAMEKWLGRCAVYFGGAGVTACEAALLGLRLILCPVAENQRGNARALEAAGAKVLCSPVVPAALRNALRAEAEGGQPALALDALGLDGRGAERLAQALCERVSSCEQVSSCERVSSCEQVSS